MEQVSDIPILEFLESCSAKGRSDWDWPTSSTSSTSECPSKRDICSPSPSPSPRSWTGGRDKTGQGVEFDEKRPGEVGERKEEGLVCHRVMRGRLDEND